MNEWRLGIHTLSTHVRMIINIKHTFSLYKSNLHRNYLLKSLFVGARHILLCSVMSVTSTSPTSSNISTFSVPKPWRQSLAAEDT